MYWARSYLKAVGALKESRRGIWSITSAGSEYLKLQPVQAENRLREVDDVVRAKWRKATGQREFEDEVEDTVDEPTWREQILTALEAMDRSAFDRWRY